MIKKQIRRNKLDHDKFLEIYDIFQKSNRMARIQTKIKKVITGGARGMNV